VVDTSDVLAAVRTKRGVLGILVSSCKGKFSKGKKEKKKHYCLSLCF
jgi:hypothetical protein